MQDLPIRVDRVLAGAVAEQRIVGATAFVMRGGALAYRGAVGLANREANIAMTTTTPHRLASLTKPVTAVTTLAMIARNQLALDQPVTRWLPDFVPRFGDIAPPITIHHLLTHTSGLGYSFLELPEGPYHRANVSDGLDQPGLSLDENLRRLASMPLLCMPGTGFNYSLSMDVLGAVLERAGDAALPDLVTRHVTGPLELDLSFAPRSGLATPYSDGKPPKLIRAGDPVPFFPPFATSFDPARALDRTSYPSGGAGMVGTAESFVRFLDAVRTRAIPNVPATLIDAMLRDQIAPLTSPTLTDAWGYGYGVAVLRDPTQSALPPGAVRWGGAYGHSWFIAGDTCSVLLTNTAFEGMNGRLRDEMERAVTNR
jgi:CubicO group peptidase (beta-lactamase class C family)